MGQTEIRGKGGGGDGCEPPKATREMGTGGGEVSESRSGGGERREGSSGCDA